MSVLLDTNVLIWWLEESPRLGARARDVISSEHEVVVSAVSAFEIAAKTAIGKLHTPDDFAERIADESMIELPSRYATG